MSWWNVSVLLKEKEIEKKSLMQDFVVARQI